ncbi:hypothetical protein Aph01nite_64730 [Acrocarpospora phusangensis]|uniref:Uncharacterized protein n=1 Tax=Acrocarpospora phusangensis TaxID=1070424 RepID=A0A919QG40_9ACTN|nr:hypothetical protein Aph01nite_64730 [Acrocarpospora phusangensis]
MPVQDGVGQKCGGVAAIGSVTASTTRRDSPHSRAGRLMREWTTSTRVAADAMTRRSSARASQAVTARSRWTALASLSLSRTRVPPGGNGSRGARYTVGLFPPGLVELVA